MGILALLRDAARRGVRVRLLIDAQWNRIPEALQAHLVAEGVGIREYHPFRPWKPRWWTRRLHDKILVVDGEHLVVGGRNIESPYYGRGREVGRRDYVDRDAYVVGASASKALAYFDAVWTGGRVRKTDLGPHAPSRLGRRCELRMTEEDRARCARLLREAREAIEEARLVLDAHRSGLDGDDLFRASERLPPAAAASEVGPVRFLHDPPEGKRAGAGIGLALLDLFDRAERRIAIESPYLVPSKALRRALERARDRGVRVRILTNSLASTDNVLAQAGYAGRKDDLVGLGVELWEFGGPESLHSKSAVLDDRILIVGSFNLDPRSEKLNSEVAVVVDDPASAARVLETMERNLTRSVRIGPAGKPTEGVERYAPVPGGKRCKLRLLRLVAPLIHDQL